jgi:methionyl-tRNA formyltransferase
MKLAFAGTPEFARVALEALFAAGHEVALVLTQPDRPAGRGLKLQASPVKSFALAHGLALAQPRSLRLDGRHPDDASAARALVEHVAPEAMVVAAYGLILPAWALALPLRGCLNIHGSLLPRWRGAAPVQRAIEAGDPQTGVTIMQMDAGLDTGACLLSRAEPIAADDSSGSLLDRLARLGAEMVVEALAGLQAGRLVAQPQPADGVCYAHKIEKSEAAIDWRAPAALIERRLRAFDPYPGCTATIADTPLKVWRGRVVPAVDAAAGAPIEAADGRLVVACGDGALEVLELQLAGGRRMPAQGFLQIRPRRSG